MTLTKYDNMTPPPGYKGPARKGGWIQCFSGHPFWPLDPRPEDIRGEDIAHALAHQCRFAGHCETFYSVAEHCIRASFIVPEEDALWALLHDAPEAYLVDLPRPIKHSPGLAGSYQRIERNLMAMVCQVFDLPPEEPESVKAADLQLLETEFRDLMDSHGDGPLYSVGVEPLEERIYPLPSAEVEGVFTRRLLELTGSLEAEE